MNGIIVAAFALLSAASAPVAAVLVGCATIIGVGIAYQQTQLLEQQNEIIKRQVQTELLAKLTTDAAPYARYSAFVELLAQGHQDFSKCNLNDLDLRSVGCSLSECKFRDAFLIEANLQDLDLQKADFTRALLFGANLRGANLAEAHLTAAKLSGATMDNADVAGATIGEAIFHEYRYPRDGRGLVSYRAVELAKLCLSRVKAKESALFVPPKEAKKVAPNKEESKKS